MNTAIKKNEDKTSVIDCIQSGKILEYKGEIIAETLVNYFANVGKEFAEKINTGWVRLIRTLFIQSST